MILYVDLHSLKRLIPFPYPLIAAGYFQDFTTRPMLHRYRNTVEFCLRLSSEEKTAEDRFNGKCVQTPFPHCVIKRPGPDHYFEVNHPRSGLFLLYDISVAERLKKLSLIPEWFIRKLSPDPALYRLCTAFREMLGHSREHAAADRLDLLAFSLLEELRFHFLQETEPADEETRILRAASRFQTDLTEDLTLAEAAAAAGFSERNFYRAWKKYMPETPGSYLMKLKMKEAEHLLEATAFPVERIARLLHFRDEHYFSTVFRRYAGVPPSVYRKTKWKNDLPR